MVPIFGNRLVWREAFSLVGSVILGLALIAALVIGFLQWNDPADVRGNPWLGILIVHASVFGVVMLFILIYAAIKRRLVYRFSMDREEATALEVRGKWVRVMAGTAALLAAFDGRPALAAAGAAGAAEEPEPRRVPWDKLRKVRAHPDLLAVSLYRWPWPGLPLVLYMPHREGYRRVVAKIRELCPHIDMA